jgi:hypothetical protein
MAGTDNDICMGPRERRTVFFQKLNFGADLHLLAVCKGFPPISKLIGVFDFPSHLTSMPFMEYSVKGILREPGAPFLARFMREKWDVLRL